MKSREGWIQRLAEGMEGDMPWLPLVEICGERRVLIEHHRGVSRYGPDRICVRVSFGEIAVRGCGLELAQMTGEQIVIRGRIDGIALCRKGDGGR